MKYSLYFIQNNCLYLKQENITYTQDTSNINNKLKCKANYLIEQSFKNLEEKGDQPITGADLTKLLDEIQQFFYS